MLSIGVAAEPIRTDRINRFLLENNILIKENPCISPDFCLNWPGLCHRLGSSDISKELTVYDISKFTTASGDFYLSEDESTGDYVWLLVAPKGGKKGGKKDAKRQKTLASSLLEGIDLSDSKFTNAYPATWANCLKLKNEVQEADPESTIFPSATGTLEYQSLGIGARMTTLHWPAVDWCMKNMNLSVTANQNSIPRELVYDINEMLDDNLDFCLFPFIGTSIPEGHQGQSVEGMSHGCVITKVKHGFHLNGIAWGFNADHQPIGGKYDSREDELVRGSLLATYITFDISHELEITKIPADPEAWVARNVPKKTTDAIAAKVKEVGIKADHLEFCKLIAYVWPAMQKMKVRDLKYAAARAHAFSTEIGCNYYREMSIDELPGLTTPATLATILALCEYMEMPANFVAPAFGWQKNFPFADNVELEKRISAAWKVCEGFGTSIGFHSGSGKSAENYELCGKITGSKLEIKTSGRYTYALGVAVSKSKDKSDQKLWKEWYAWTVEVATTSAFAGGAEQEMARSFISQSFTTDKVAEPADLFESKKSCMKGINTLTPSPDHMLYFEYNFLFLLAANGSPEKSAMGNQKPEGYRQRARFYGGLSAEGRLQFAKEIAGYIIFLAETTGQVKKAKCAAVRKQLDACKTYAEFTGQIAPA
jgi:hypothetical protein